MRTTILFLMVVLAGCDKPIITIDLKGQPNIPAQPAPPRFEIKQTDLGMFLLDSEKGQVWKMTKYVDVEGEPVAWVSMDIVSMNSSGSGAEPQSFLDWYGLHKRVEKK